MPADSVLVLAYSGCSTCKKALAWLTAHRIAHVVRPIVEKPPTRAELEAWIPASGLPVSKWLNTSGQSYRALGKERVAAASEGELLRWLTEDGKLVKRPVVVVEGGARVLVGFKEDVYETAFAE
jgi:arsenate reductase